VEVEVVNGELGHSWGLVVGEMRSPALALSCQNAAVEVLSGEAGFFDRLPSSGSLRMTGRS
jgi:hypothetical protein